MLLLNIPRFNTGPLGGPRRRISSLLNVDRTSPRPRFNTSNPLLNIGSQIANVPFRNPAALVNPLAQHYTDRGIMPFTPVPKRKRVPDPSPYVPPGEGDDDGSQTTNVVVVDEDSDVSPSFGSGDPSTVASIVDTRSDGSPTDITATGDEWYDYTDSQQNVQNWIDNKVNYPAASAINALTGPVGWAIEAFTGRSPGEMVEGIDFTPQDMEMEEFTYQAMDPDKQIAMMEAGMGETDISPESLALMTDTYTSQIPAHINVPGTEAWDIDYKEDDFMAGDALDYPKRPIAIAGTTIPPAVYQAFSQNPGATVDALGDDYNNPEGVSSDLAETIAEQTKEITGDWTFNPMDHTEGTRTDKAISQALMSGLTPEQVAGIKADLELAAKPEFDIKNPNALAERIQEVIDNQRTGITKFGTDVELPSGIDFEEVGEQSVVDPGYQAEINEAWGLGDEDDDDRSDEEIDEDMGFGDDSEW